MRRNKFRGRMTINRSLSSLMRSSRWSSRLMSTLSEIRCLRRTCIRVYWTGRATWDLCRIEIDLLMMWEGQQFNKRMTWFVNRSKTVRGLSRLRRSSPMLRIRSTEKSSMSSCRMRVESSRKWRIRNRYIESYSIIKSISISNW